MVVSLWYTRAPAPYIYAVEINCKYIEIVVDTMRRCFRMTPSSKQTDKQNKANNMKDLISKLSKADQKAVNMAIMHTNYGNPEATIRVIDGMVRAANNRSAPILTAIRAAL